VGAKPLADRHSFWISTGRVMSAVLTRLLTLSPVGHSREQAS
jgi:hypothetical protein